MLIALQPSLAGTGVSPVEIRSMARRQATANRRPSAELENYRRRLVATGAAKKTVQAYVYQLHSLAETAASPEGFMALFLHPEALGQALVDDRSSEGRQLSKWTLDQRRSAVQSFARLMSPELRRLTGREPLGIVTVALRRSALRVGGRFILTGGAPRRRGGPAPSPDDVAAIIREAARALTFKGRRNEAFFTILYESGSRVNALREASCADLVVLPMGTARLMLHAKGRCQPREIELTPHARRLLFAYIDEFNERAWLHGTLEQLIGGESTTLWRSTWIAQWSYPNVRQTFQKACLAAGTRAYRLHAFRRAFASEAAAILPRYTVALAGGWQGLERMDDHYIRPQVRSIAEKMAAASSQANREPPDKCRSLSFSWRP